MKAAIVKAPGSIPIYSEFDEPIISEGTVLVAVEASALSHITKMRASGKHYSSSGNMSFVPGVDGAGTLEDGTRVYFVLPEKPFGGMAERCIVKRDQCIVLPLELDYEKAAAIAIPGMSSWAALVERAKLVKGETVLINGATGISGSLAVQIAKHLGAGKVIATGRNSEALKSLITIGADLTINLSQDKDILEEQMKTEFSKGIAIVLDYLWGESAELILVAAAKAGPEGVPIRFVQIGSISSQTITLPSAALRSSSLELIGSGMGSIPMDRILESIKNLFQATIPSKLEISTKVVPLSNIEQSWGDETSNYRTVFAIGNR